MQNWPKKHSLLQSLSAMTNHSQQVGIIRSNWLTLRSVLITGGACMRTICKSYTGKLPRAWADKTLVQWSKSLLNVSKASIQVHNPLDINMQTGKPTILMCNHSSVYDIPMTYVAFPNISIRMLAKKELSRIPIFGRAMRQADFPFIDRKNRNQAIQDLAHAKSLMESGIVLWIAPEGTRSKSGKLQAFKKGGFITAIQAKATIIPIGICGAHKILPAGTRKFHLNQQADIYVGQPIDASKYTLENKQELIDKVHVAMEKLCNP